MFKNAIVRRPGRSLIQGITSANLGKPVHNDALVQHDRYVQALERCDVNVTILEAEETFPDSVFVEDTAVVTERCAVITHPGAKPRQGEEVSVEAALQRFYASDSMESIRYPGTLEGGDVMRVGDHFYVGLSARTNEEGFRQFKGCLKKYGYTASPVRLERVLHLKTGVSYLETNTLLVAGEFMDCAAFANFNRIIVDDSEAYAANSVWINGTVLVPLGFPKTKAAIEQAGYRVLDVDVSEYRKLDGGLSCLSLRF
ncbi:MAG: dimethylarginine dimethylaminohydrolase family protein [Candidatus Omnitrophota bacterium]